MAPALPAVKNWKRNWPCGCWVWHHSQWCLRSGRKEHRSCRGSVGSTQEIGLWLTLGELLNFSSCAGCETTMSKMSCHDELWLPRASSHSSYCPGSNCRYGYLYVCSQLCQIKGWWELRGRKVSPVYADGKVYKWRSAGSASLRNLPGLQHFLLNFQHLPGHAAIFHGFLSTNLVSYCQMIYLLQRMQGLSSMSTRLSTPAGLVARFLLLVCPTETISM